MKKRTVTVISFLLIAAMGIAGCGNGKQDSGQNDTGNGDTKTTEVKTSEEITGPLYKYKDTVKLSVGQFISDEKLFPEGMDSAHNAMYDLMKDVMNIELTPAFTAPKTDAFKEQVSRLQMADNLPDMTPMDVSTLYDAIKADQLVDLKPYYDKYASPTLKKMLEVNNGAFLEACTKDGKLYAIPEITDQFNNVPIMWVRTDWIDICGWKNAKGGDLPETYEDFETMLYAFRDHYAEISEATGVEDVYAFATYKDLGTPFSGIMAAHNAYPMIYQTNSDGSYYYGSLTPEVKEGLATLNRYQNDGILREDWATQPTEQIVADSGAGKVGVFFDQFWGALAGQVGGFMWLVIGAPDDNPKLKDGNWASVPIPAKDGGLIQPPFSAQAGFYYAVSKKCQNPEAIILMFNQIAEGNNDEGTAKGEAAKEGYYSEYSAKYRAIEEAYPGKMPYAWLPIFLDNPMKNANLTVKFQKIRNGEMSADDLLPGEKQVWNEQVNNADPFVSWQYTNVYLDNGVPSCMEYTEFENNKYVGAPTETMKKNGQTLTNTEMSAFVNFITGKDSLDNYDKFIENFNNLGGSAVVQEINDIMK